MGQGWELFNVSLLQCASAAGGYQLWGKFFSKQKFLVRSLAIPYPVPELAGYIANAPFAGPIAKKGLLSLPDEILDMILMHDDLPIFDSACLAITCKKLLALAERSQFLECGRDNVSAGWAGCQIVCLGEYATLEKAPENLFPPDMKANMRTYFKAKDMEDTEDCYAGLYEINCVDATHNGVLYHGVWEYRHRDFVASLPVADRRLFIAAMGVTFPERYDWALFNIVKHEYVRAGALAELSGRPDDVQPFLQNCPIDLGTALLTRFCYSSDPSTSLNNKSVGIHHGKWVGDRFTVDTIERVKQRQPKLEWKDVTDEVIADIKTIYVDEYEKPWEELPRRYCDQRSEAWYFTWDDAKMLNELLPGFRPLKPSRKPPSLRRKSPSLHSTLKSTSTVTRRRCASL
ncbi:hypothetical protein TRAPUB_1761 [Trametes pubescens]|uniref:F-box domain-containing protein n=1 Tax=Trametes pubescens TaxID=154538 RepID=A0A1M2VIG9_TRAPU|nr:hypothetical protein TRAPUB_1761 [Trametes pubescens]